MAKEVIPLAKRQFPNTAQQRWLLEAIEQSLVDGKPVPQHYVEAARRVSQFAHQRWDSICANGKYDHVSLKDQFPIYQPYAALYLISLAGSVATHTTGDARFDSLDRMIGEFLEFGKESTTAAQEWQNATMLSLVSGV